MLRSITLCWNSAHIATIHFQNSPVLQTGTRCMRSCESYGIQTRLYKLVFIELGAKINGRYYRDMLLTQKVLPAIHSIAGDMFVLQQDNAPAHRARDRQSRASASWDTPVHQSWHVASQQSWPHPGRWLRLGHAATARVSSTNPRYWRVAEASCCDMGRISPKHGAVDQWGKRLEACIRAEGGHFEHLLWRRLPGIPVASHHNQFFSERPMFGGAQHHLQSDEKVLHFTR